MKTEYLYVKLHSIGESHRLIGEGFAKINLTDLLAEGWRPIRETAFRVSNDILILLERAPEGQRGFGFGP